MVEGKICLSQKQVWALTDNQAQKEVWVLTDKQALSPLSQEVKRLEDQSTCTGTKTLFKPAVQTPITSGSLHL